ncbi:hypothetical protein [Halobiforma nitratireducens]|uniref:Uncharacterized protein n=1 Tax=Halobiforma nitratireducens JCM 10879 TaxID=1227454 RepID=M0M3P5_9EURY|nr:hypothetical protein [Halobiforma nitratireducens]EMA40008.1 hypothetical protein C446_07554 [Halobiforma nitratireducens JCM 10879]
MDGPRTDGSHTGDGALERDGPTVRRDAFDTRTRRWSDPVSVPVSVVTKPAARGVAGSVNIVTHSTPSS